VVSSAARWRPTTACPSGEHERKKKSYYLVSGFVTDGLALRALALVHAPGALPAIERELERARKK
jgi:hypothetical protein